MKAFVSPTPGTLAATSKAMKRVAEALRVYAPMDVQVVERLEDADFQIVHAIGGDSISEAIAPNYAVLQYCSGETERQVDWQAFWAKSWGVWSYYRLETEKLYHAPLGVDGTTFAFSGAPRNLGIVTSGFVSGPRAEAIEEVAEAAYRLGLYVFHLGPSEIVGMQKRSEFTWHSDMNIPDGILAREYQHARFVSGLRHVEGFELPVIEGFACGARPIVFDRPEMRRWFQDFAVFIPECDGERLVKILERVLSGRFNVSPGERAKILPRFDWKTLVGGFWKEVLA